METKQKWYNSYIIGYLLIFFPPLGLYGVYKSDIIKPRWKKATYGALAFAIIGGIIIYFI